MFGVTNVVLSGENKLIYPEDMTPEMKLDSEPDRFAELRKLIQPTEHDE
jgi:hypothetical protein